MSSCEFNVGDIRRHRDGIHAPRVMFENGLLTMMGRNIPVISPEQVEARLRLIGCREPVIDQIMGGLFGFRVATEAPVAVSEVVESLA